MSRTMNQIACRWGDNDVYVGPFTFATGAYRPLAIILASGDDEGRSASFRVSAFGGTAILALPRWLVPTEKKKVFPTSWDAATIARLGRNWYIDQTQREYGVSIYEGHLSLKFGRQTHDSSTEQNWGWFIPWTQWRHVRHSLYGLDGSLFAHVPEWGHRHGLGSYDEFHRVVDACPTARFAFKDFDGEALTATTRIEEREWLFGEGWFKWLALFRECKLVRSLHLDFSGETGKRKGSWKGGTMGTSINMLPGELHEAAFRRYCAEHDMSVVGPA